MECERTSSILLFLPLKQCLKNTVPLLLIVKSSFILTKTMFITKILLNILHRCREQEIDWFIKMITSFNPFSLSIVFLSILSFLNLTTPATGANYLFHFCANSTFSANSLYQTGINSLLSSLSSNATRNLEFYNTTTNQNTSNPVYGLYLCRGDVTSEVCRGCVAEATKDLTTRCSREKIAVIWYDECMIRYSNESIFSTVIVRPRVALLNTQNITNQDQLNKLVNTSMTSLASKASDVPIGVKKFRTDEVNISAFQTLYNLVQCTPDLSSTDCNLCLQTAIIRLPICCGGKQGARVLLPSCSVWYELYGFYSTPEAPSPSPGLQSPPPPASVSGREGKVEHPISHLISFFILNYILSDGILVCVNIHGMLV